MAKYAFWNGGAIKPLRSNKNVRLSDDRLILAVTAPRPDDDIYLLETIVEPTGPFQQTGTASVECDGWTITKTIPTVWKARESVVQAITTTINAEAQRRIFDIAEDYKQANLTARGVELALELAAAGSLSQEQQDEIAAGQHVFDGIKAVRTEAKRFKALLDTMPIEDLALINVFTWVDWPVYIEPIIEEPVVEDPV